MTRLATMLVAACVLALALVAVFADPAAAGRRWHGPGVGVYVGPGGGYYGWGWGYRPYPYYRRHFPYAYYPYWRAGRYWRRGWYY